jgi:hypothetical protein
MGKCIMSTLHSESMRTVKYESDIAKSFRKGTEEASMYFNDLIH